jgi:hypothetical protein
MRFETRRLMVAYFTGGDELISRDDDYAKLPQHMVIAPWLRGELEVVADILEGVAMQYPRPLQISTGNRIPMSPGVFAREIHPEQAVRQLHSKVVSALGKYYLHLEDPDFAYKPLIVIDQDQPRLPGSMDFAVDHMAIVEDHENGTKTIADCVYME